VESRSQIRIVFPDLSGVANAHASLLNNCSHLFVSPPSAVISNSSFVDISFVLESQAFGECPVIVTVTFAHEAGIDVSSSTFMVRVLRVNQLPLFSIPFPVISVLESSGNHSISNFVRDISTGLHQDISFVVEEVSNAMNRFSISEVFATRPFIDLTGQLAFNLTSHFFGNFTFSLVLVDVTTQYGLHPRNSSTSFFHINILPPHSRNLKSGPFFNLLVRDLMRVIKRSVVLSKTHFYLHLKTNFS
jgi:hypothetical protein